MRLRVMFLAFCKHFWLNAEEIRSPFSEEIDLYEGIVPDDDLFPEEAPSSEEVSDSEETGGLVLPDVFRDDENAQTGEESLSSDGSDADDGENLPEAGETHEEG